MMAPDVPRLRFVRPAEPSSDTMTRRNRTQNFGGYGSTLAHHGGVVRHSPLTIGMP